MTAEHVAAVWVVVAAAIAAVILRPWRLPEFVWSLAGAVVLVALGLVPLREAAAAIGKGVDVYFFLAGMMLLAEAARKCGLFDWLAGRAVEAAGGSPKRLFAIVYAVGFLVTVFLSNDATAVVLTPAVLAATRKAKTDPLPHLYACALIANAASFVLPISNPANLVVYGSRTPALAAWLSQFALASALSVVATFFLLRWTQRKGLEGRVAGATKREPAPRGAFVAAAGIALAGIVLAAASARGVELGLPTFVCGVAVATAAAWRARLAPWPLLRDVSWGVLLLVAGLFVLVAGLERAELVADLSGLIERLSSVDAGVASGLAGAVAGVLSNLANNLPVGLLAGSVAHAAHASAALKGSLLLGVDVGPELSVTGSLATILWLIALRREGLHVDAWRFLRIGFVVAPPTLILTLAALALQTR